MTIATRRKQPERVRRLLLEAAMRIGAEKGLTDVKVEAVCREAGVTKGAFFHHFPTKAALIEAVFDDLLERLAAQLAALMAEDPEPHGRLTRAYLRAATDPGDAGCDPLWIALYASALTGAELRGRWGRWLTGKLAEAPREGEGMNLRVVRLAADGLWFAAMDGESPDAAGLEQTLEHLRRLTYAGAEPS